MSSSLTTTFQFSAGEQAALAAALTSAPMPYRLALLLLWETEVGVSELFALTLDDVNLTPGHECLHVPARAGRGARVVLLGPIATPRALSLLRHMLFSHQLYEPGRPLLNGPRGPATYAALRYQWQRLCRRAGLVGRADEPRYTLRHVRSLARSSSIRSPHSDGR